MRSLTPLVIAATCCLGPGAWAQSLAPSFATMDRNDGANKFGADVAWTQIDAEDVTALRIDVHGQYVNRTGLGAYAHLPVSMIITENESDSGIGNIEIGAIQNLWGRNRTISLRAGLTAPTAADDAGGFFANYVNTFGRLTDIAQIYPETTWLRLSASPIFRSGSIFFRGDVGLDVALSSQGEEPEPFLRINLGMGGLLGQVAVMGELVTVVNTDDAVEEETAHTLAVTVRLINSTFQPHLAIIVPFASSEIDEVFDAVLMAGIVSYF